MGPLKGIRVLDLSQVVAGPFAAMMLADMGADVIKIEPPGGEVMRTVPAVERNGVAVGMLNWNRNKRAMVIDFKRDGGAEVFLRMAERAQVVIQNFRPGVVDRLGVGYEAARKRNPAIVYCSMAGYGFTGPYADKPAYDPVIQGLAGVMVSQTTQGRPRVVKNILADKVTAMTAAFSIAAALNAARDGIGQHIEIAMMDAVAYYLMPDTMTMRTFLPDKPGTPPMKGTAEPFETSDGFITIAPLTDKHWTSILKAVGHPEWFEGDAPRNERLKHAGRSLIELFKTKPSAYWLEKIEAADVPCGPINNYDTIWTDPQYIVNETFFEYEHPKAGRVRAVRTPGRFSATPPELWRHAPDLAANTDEILADSGFKAGEIADLRARQIVS
jgi:crotonobetainyl-CoA:carnitine CoA-transferase CaiB-like acyl-CoA transferase